MNRKNVTLKEVMTMELEHFVRVWSTPGLNVKEVNIPENANVKDTFVMAHGGRDIIVGIQFEIDGDEAHYMEPVAEFSTLEELQDKFPNLFELNGTMYAFG